MNWANPALYVAIASLVTAIGGVIALFVHVKGNTDQPPPKVPPA